MDKKIKVLVYGMSNNIGGVETFIKNVYGNSNNGLFEFHYCCSQVPNENYNFLINNGGIVHQVIGSRHKYIKYFLFWNKFFLENKFDIIINNACDILSIDIMKFAKWNNVPVRILHSHSSGLEINLNVLHRIEENHNRKILDKYVTNFWACSSVAGKWMFDNRNYTLIRNGINIDKFKYNPSKRVNFRQNMKINDEIVFCFVGRITILKNPFKALDVFDFFNKTFNSESKMLFVGSGPLEEELKSYISLKNCKENVTLLGRRNDVDEILSACDCLIMTSDFEGLPFVLVEAQASGLPCVVIDNVSKEAAVTDLFYSVSSDAELSDWVQIICDALNNKKDRAFYSKEVKSIGFDIENTISEVNDILVESFNNYKKIN